MINRFDVAHIHHTNRNIELFSQLLSNCHTWINPTTESENRHRIRRIAIFSNDFRLPKWQNRHLCNDLYTYTCTTWITHCRRAWIMICSVQHLTAFIFVFRCKDHHIWHSTHVGIIIRPSMGWTIFANQTCTINRKSHIEILQCHIVNQLIIATL